MITSKHKKYTRKIRICIICNHEYRYVYKISGLKTCCEKCSKELERIDKLKAQKEFQKRNPKYQQKYNQKYYKKHVLNMDI